MRCGLLDALTGRFPNGERVADVPEEEHRLRSVLGNLQRLFNTRQGSLAHVPEFGLPDITDISHAAPDRVEALRRDIREAVERFEPRLRRVRVEQERRDAAASHLVFLLVAELVPGGRIQLQTLIRADDLVEIRPKQATE